MILKIEVNLKGFTPSTFWINEKTGRIASENEVIGFVGNRKDINILQLNKHFKKMLTEGGSLQIEAVKKIEPKYRLIKE